MTVFKKISYLVLTGYLISSQAANAINLNISIFGGNGDLAIRKLYPAIYKLETNNLIPNSTQITAIGLTNLSTEEFRALIKKSF